MAGANRFVRLFGVEPQSELRSVHTLEELGLLLEESRVAGAIAFPHAEMFARTFEFPDKRVHEAMVPRSDVAACSIGNGVEAILDLARMTGHSRFPVYADQQEEFVAGVVHLADMLRAADRRGDATAKDAMREPLVVPESLRLDVLIGQMNHARAHLAVVIDEYGSTSGIITLGDILAELVGEVADEHSDPAQTVRRLEHGYRVPGMIHLHELHRATGCALPEGDYETLGGFINQRLGRLAHHGDEVILDVWRLRVVAVRKHRILTVDLESLDRAAP